MTNGNTDDGIHWDKSSLYFNDLGLPFTVPPWDQHFPKHSFTQYGWLEVCRMNGLELLQHFTTRFNPTYSCSRVSLRQVVYRCNLISACRREFAGFVGVQKVVRHMTRHLVKLDEHRKLCQANQEYVDSLVFYAVGDKFPTGIRVPECPPDRHCIVDIYQDNPRYQGVTEAQVAPSFSEIEGAKSVYEEVNSDTQKIAPNVLRINSPTENHNATPFSNPPRIITTETLGNENVNMKHETSLAKSPCLTDTKVSSHTLASEEDVDLTSTVYLPSDGSRNLSKQVKTPESLIQDSTQIFDPICEGLATQITKGESTLDSPCTSSQLSPAHPIILPVSLCAKSKDITKASLQGITNLCKRLQNDHSIDWRTNEQDKNLKENRVVSGEQSHLSTSHSTKMTVRYSTIAAPYVKNSQVIYLRRIPEPPDDNISWESEESVCCIASVTSLAPGYAGDGRDYCPENYQYQNNYCSPEVVQNDLHTQVGRTNSQGQYAQFMTQDSGARAVSNGLQQPEQMYTGVPIEGSAGVADKQPVMMECTDYIDRLNCSSLYPGEQQQDGDDFSSLVSTYPIYQAISSPPNIAPIVTLGIPVSQSKYGELLAVIEELGKDIRPTYAGSKNASERLKKGIMHARALVRECLIETERCARQ